MPNNKYKISNIRWLRFIGHWYYWTLVLLLPSKGKICLFDIPHFGGVGQSLIELIIAIGVAAVILPALFFGFMTSTQSKAQETQSLQANALMNEGLEAARAVREANWSNIATNGDYHPVIVTNSWTLVAGTEIINQYTRIVNIADVSRDSNGNVVLSGGTVDPSTKKITVTISWTTPYAAQVSTTIYLTRYLNNQSILQPSPAPPAILFSTFTAANSSGVVANNANVKLTDAGAGKGDWCAATPKVVTRLASGEIISAMWATVLGTTPPTNRVYFGTGGSQYDVDVYTVGVADPQIPNPVPVATLGARSTTGYETNDIFGEPNNAYIASNSTTKHIVIYSITSSITEVGSVNLNTVSIATGVFVMGNTGYAVAGSNLYTFDLTNKNGARIPLKTFPLGANAKKLYVVDTSRGIFAFIAMSTTTNQLRVVDVTDRLNPVLASSLTVVGQAGQDVFASPDGLRAYLVTAHSATQSEFFIIDTSNIFSRGVIPAPIGTYNLDPNVMSPRAVKMVLSKNRAIIVGTGGTEQYVVLDIGKESAPIRCSGMVVAGGSAFAVSPILETDGDAYAYIATNDQSNQFQIIEGGPGTQYSSTGIYESTTFDPGASVSFNRFQSTFDQPVGTNITFQVAVAPAVGNSCIGVTFTFQNLSNVTTSTVGTTTSYNGVIAYPGNQGRCLRYRATLIPTSDFKFSPTLQSVTINYTP